MDMFGVLDGMLWPHAANAASNLRTIVSRLILYVTEKSGR